MIVQYFNICNQLKEEKEKESYSLKFSDAAEFSW